MASRDALAQTSTRPDPSRMLAGFSEAELVDLVAIGGADVQRALAEMASLASPVAAALAESADEAAVVTLLSNRSARIPAFAYRRVIKRFGHDERVLGALEARSGLPDPLWPEIMVARLRLLLEGVPEPYSTDDIERGLVALLWSVEERARLIHGLLLLRSGHATASLLLRAARADAKPAVACLLALATQTPLAEAEAVLMRRDETELLALLSSAGVPKGLYRDFLAAFSAMDDTDGHIDHAA